MTDGQQKCFVVETDSHTRLGHHTFNNLSQHHGKDRPTMPVLHPEVKIMYR